jgi:hypothetical protein
MVEKPLALLQFNRPCSHVPRGLPQTALHLGKAAAADGSADSDPHVLWTSMALCFLHMLQCPTGGSLFSHTIHPRCPRLLAAGGAWQDCVSRKALLHHLLDASRLFARQPMGM